MTAIQVDQENTVYKNYKTLFKKKIYSVPHVMIMDQYAAVDYRFQNYKTWQETFFQN